MGIMDLCKLILRFMPQMQIRNFWNITMRNMRRSCRKSGQRTGNFLIIILTRFSCFDESHTEKSNWNVKSPEEGKEEEDNDDEKS
mmetsp:Transcript_22146/g.32977  ORF Transcript_22146/g.32977 Transcript_22146/m.32977 type:complete len:85 (-) Transcript_22146:135-389(-)